MEGADGPLQALVWENREPCLIACRTGAVLLNTLDAQLAVVVPTARHEVRLAKHRETDGALHLEDFLRLLYKLAVKSALPPALCSSSSCRVGSW